MSAFVRSQTNLEEAETSPFAHKYMIKRPRLRQASTTNSIDLNVNTNRRAGAFPSPSNGAAHGSRHASLPEEEPRIDNPAVEKCRFELFIDLIWVGIISNLAEHFSDQAFGTDSTVSTNDAILEFIVLFLVAWRIWKDLQEFMNRYQTNDVVERLFVVWIIILATMYGNNAPFLFDAREPSNVAIVIFLVILASFLLIESAYSVFLPSLRRELAFRVVFTVLTLSLWTPAIFTTYPVKAGLVFAAIFMQYLIAALADTPPVERLFKREHSTNVDMDHWVERIQDFYIIILGEGVMSLIKGSPLGQGLTDQAGTGVLALLAYYVLSGFYFNGDLSRKYVHAVRRTWWRKSLWLLFHTVISASTLILGVSSVPLIENPTLNAENSQLIEGRNEMAPDSNHNTEIIYAAKWVVSISLSIAIICQTGIALLSRSLDRKGSLKVSNRYVRLLPRLLVVAIVICLPIDRKMTGRIFMTVIVSLLLGCLDWEWIVSLERHGGLLEP